MEGLDGIGGPNINNIQGPSNNFQSPKINKSAVEKLPSTQDVSKELKSKSDNADIEGLMKGLTQALSDGSGRPLAGAEKSLLLTPLTDSAAKNIAKTLEKSEQKSTVGGVASALIGSAFLERANKDKGKA